MASTRCSFETRGTKKKLARDLRWRHDDASRQTARLHIVFLSAWSKELRHPINPDFHMRRGWHADLTRASRSRIRCIAYRGTRVFIASFVLFINGKRERDLHPSYPWKFIEFDCGRLPLCPSSRASTNCKLEMQNGVQWQRGHFSCFCNLRIIFFFPAVNANGH